MKYVAIFHANLNYAYLTPDRYEFVIRKSYELIFDVMEQQFPGAKFVFEASGYTLDEIAGRCPDVLVKIRRACEQGRCEFMGSPYAHPMLPNFPKEDGIWSIRFSNESYQKHLGFVPRSFWNPECGWCGYVPEQVVAAGYANMIGDFEAYSRSCGPDGKPLRPEIYEKEHTKERAFYHFGFKYDLPGTERTVHFPFTQVAGLPADKLRMFLRTDRIAQFGVRYFMGMEGYTFDKYLALIDRYSQQNPGEPEGAVIIFADDAEYVGTNGWFRLKYENKPDNTFEHTPESREKLIALVSACLRRGSFATFDEACRLPPNPERIHFDDDTAWHGGRASTWASTPMAKLLRPWQELVRDKLLKSNLSGEVERQAWLSLDELLQLRRSMAANPARRPAHHPSVQLWLLFREPAAGRVACRRHRPRAIDDRCGGHARGHFVPATGVDPQEGGTTSLRWQRMREAERGLGKDAHRDLRRTSTCPHFAARAPAVRVPGLRRRDGGRPAAGGRRGDRSRPRHEGWRSEMTLRQDLITVLDGGTPQRTPLSIYDWNMGAITAEELAAKMRSDDWRRLLDLGLGVTGHCEIIEAVEHEVETVTEERREGDAVYATIRKRTPLGEIRKITRNGWHHEDWIKQPARLPRCAMDRRAHRTAAPL